MSNFPVEPGTSIQNAIDRAAADGGGTVVLNPGLHRTGTIYLKSNIELHLSAGACLCGGERPEEYDELPEKAYGEEQNLPRDRSRSGLLWIVRDLSVCARC